MEWNTNYPLLTPPPTETDLGSPSAGEGDVVLGAYLDRCVPLLLVVDVGRPVGSSCGHVDRQLFLVGIGVGLDRLSEATKELLVGLRGL